MVPAAVVSIGKYLGSSPAAISTARYPAAVAIDESASMLCARVDRGINSTANEVAPVAATSCTISSEPSGRRKPIRTLLFPSSGRSALPVRSLEPWQRT